MVKNSIHFSVHYNSILRSQNRILPRRRKQHSDQTLYRTHFNANRTHLHHIFQLESGYRFGNHSICSPCLPQLQNLPSMLFLNFHSEIFILKLICMHNKTISNSWGFDCKRSIASGNQKIESKEFSGSLDLMVRKLNCHFMLLDSVHMQYLTLST